MLLTAFPKPTSAPSQPQETVVHDRRITVDGHARALRAPFALSLPLTPGEHRVRVEAEDLMTGRRRHTNSCYLTFVAVDRNGRPIEVPELVPETVDELRRYGAAQQRRRRRLEERESEEKTKS